MTELGPYTLIIAGSCIILLSFLFGEISKKTNIPSVLMLIALGVVLKFVMESMNLGAVNYFPYLELLGIVGLIMIVLEAALELKLERKKLPMIIKSMVVALLGLVASAFAAAFLLDLFIPDMDFMHALVYATPLSILSSAIIIPSVGNLSEEKKEFHVYESTFSDILGIMMFYFILAQAEPGHGGGNAVSGFFISLGITLVISLVASYLLIIVFQKIKSQAKLFLLIAILLMLYAIGKKMHLSSLIIILIFGLVITNMKLFFKGFLFKFYDHHKAHQIHEELHIVTLETAFVVRTFFFVIFGLSIALSTLLSIQVLYVSICLLVSIYVIRWLFLRVFIGKFLFPQLYIAPRGLITILLFYAIPPSLQVSTFNSGILLFVIIATGIIMTISLIMDSRKRDKKLSETTKSELKMDEAPLPEPEF